MYIIVSFYLGSFNKNPFFESSVSIVIVLVFLKHAWLTEVAIAKISQAQQEGIILLNRKNHMITLIYRLLDFWLLAQLLKRN